MQSQGEEAGDGREPAGPGGFVRSTGSAHGGPSLRSIVFDSEAVRVVRLQLGSDRVVPSAKVASGPVRDTLVYGLRGRSDVETSDGAHCHVDRQRAVWIKGPHLHRVSADSPAALVIVALRGSAGHSATQSYQTDIDGHCAQLRLLKAAVHNLSVSDVARSAELSDVVERYIVALAELCATSVALAGPRQEGAPSCTEQLLRVISVIRSRFHEPGFRLADLAYEVGMSTRSLSLLLKRSGRSFTDRVRGERLRKARELLCNQAERRSIGSIALAVGYSDISHFNRCYRAHFNEVPTHVRSSLRLAAR